MPVTGVLTWMPTANQRGEVSFEVRAYDGRGGFGRLAWDVQVGVADGNMAPSLIPLSDRVSDEGVPLIVAVGVLDPDGTPVETDRYAAVTVDVPARLLGGTFVETPGRLGPWQASNGDLYFIMEPAESFNVLMVVKSTDGGAIWTKKHSNRAFSLISMTALPPVKTIENMGQLVPGNTGAGIGYMDG